MENDARVEEQAWLYMRTLEDRDESVPARAAAAGVIAPGLRQRAVPVVLSDFEIIQMTEPCEQEELKKIQAHFMTLAQSANRGLTSPEDRAQLGHTIEERMARYGASAEHI